MRAMIIHLLGTCLQTHVPETDKEIAMLEGTIFIPAIGIIMAVVIVAGIAITVQKHKRY